MFLPPVHGQGMGLLAAPVTLLTTSLTAIRIWMSVLSAVGLFLAVLCWRGLRPVWVLALAELILGEPGDHQNSGVQVYPDWWGALGLLALTGLFLHAVNGTMRARGRAAVDRVRQPDHRPDAAAEHRLPHGPGRSLPARGAGLAEASGCWSRWRVGTALGFMEWVAGAYLWFGGLTKRIHLAGQEPPPLQPVLRARHSGAGT